MKRKVTFIIGGARSGKSSFAMSEALKLKAKRLILPLHRHWMKR